MLTHAFVTQLLAVDERNPLWIRGACIVEKKSPYCTHLTVKVDTTGRFSFKPTFILLILPQSSSRTYAIIRGACVCSNRMAFYSYNRELEVFTPESHLVQEQFFDFDLTEDAGATHMLTVIEEVKDMCRELLGELKV